MKTKIEAFKRIIKLFILVFQNGIMSQLAEISFVLLFEEWMYGFYIVCGGNKSLP